MEICVESTRKFYLAYCLTFILFPTESFRESMKDVSQVPELIAEEDGEGSRHDFPDVKHSQIHSCNNDKYFVVFLFSFFISFFFLSNSFIPF